MLVRSMAILTFEADDDRRPPRLSGRFSGRFRTPRATEIWTCMSLEPSQPGGNQPTSLKASTLGGGDATAQILERLRMHGAKHTRYFQRGEVARGGMGVILRVWDEDLRRELAMKVVLGASGQASTGEISPKMLGRFLEEAQVTGQLDHPGIVPVHELGLDER